MTEALTGRLSELSSDQSVQVCVWKLTRVAPGPDFSNTSRAVKVLKAASGGTTSGTAFVVTLSLTNPANNFTAHQTEEPRLRAVKKQWAVIVAKPQPLATLLVVLAVFFAAPLSDSRLKNSGSPAKGCVYTHNINACVYMCIYIHNPENCIHLYLRMMHANIYTHVFIMQT